MENLRTLALAGRFMTWPSPKSVPNLRSLSIGPCTEEAAPGRVPPFAPDCLCLIRVLKFRALEELSVHLAGGVGGGGAAAAWGLGALGVLGGAGGGRELGLDLSRPLLALNRGLHGARRRAPRLRVLRLAVSGALAHATPAFGAAITSLLRTAKNILVEYDRDLFCPASKESKALAACTRLRRASLTLAEPAAAVAANPEWLAALAPLAKMAAEPAPAPGALVLARRPGDESDWGAIRALLGDRWRLE
eukprot:tig00000383_g24629.t1